MGAIHMDESTRKIEFQAQTYMRLKEERDIANEKMEHCKLVLEREMKSAGEETVLVRWNDEKDIKIQAGESRRKKLDKEQMADDLQIAVDTIKTDLLLKLVEDGKLTYEDYKNYMFEEQRPTISIRLVKAD